MVTITLNEKQRRRCEIITRLIANKISSSQASELLRVTERQVHRIRRRYEADGLETVVHGNQGRRLPRCTKPAVIEQLRELAGSTGRYHDFNVSHLAELLTRDEGIQIARSTMSRLLIAHHIRPPRITRTVVKRMQRERKSAEGIMLQTGKSNRSEVASAGGRARGRPAEARAWSVPQSDPWRRFDFTENSMQARERRSELCILRK
jgi:transposase